MKRKWRKWRRQSLKKLKVFSAYFVVAIVLGIGTILFLGHIRPVSPAENWTEEERKDDFIERLAPVAQKLQASHGIWPSVMIAQAALESDWGQSDLAQEANNLFGIKSSSAGADYSTKEYDENSGWTEIQATFRRYDHWEQSMEDYANLILHGTDWNPSLYHPSLHAQNYEEAAYAIAQAGYATDPHYAQKLIELISVYQLDQFD